MNRTYGTTSVVMATYNGGLFLKEQLDSIVNQTIMPNEIVCFDDGSTDDTWQILQSYQRQYPEVIHVYKGTPTGSPDMNFKRAFQMATSDIIIPSDQDDRWRPNKIQTLLESMSDDVDVVFAHDDILYEDGSIGGDKKCDILPPHMLLFRGYLKGHTCAFRSSLLRVFDFIYSCGTGICWDGVLSYYGSFTGRIKCIPDILVTWRRHPGAVTFSAFNSTGDKASLKSNGDKWFFVKESIKLLRSNFFSTAVSCSMIARASLLEYLLNNYQLVVTRKTVKVMCNICKGLSHQTVYSLLLSGINNMRLFCLTRHFANVSKKEWIAGWLYSFREPYNWYYKYHLDKYLS